MPALRLAFQWRSHSWLRAFPPAAHPFPMASIEGAPGCHSVKLAETQIAAIHRVTIFRVSLLAHSSQIAALPVFSAGGQRLSRSRLGESGRKERGQKWLRYLKRAASLTLFMGKVTLRRHEFSC
jgi:hypothetical protein